MWRRTNCLSSRACQELCVKDLRVESRGLKFCCHLFLPRSKKKRRRGLMIETLDGMSQWVYQGCLGGPFNPLWTSRSQPFAPLFVCLLFCQQAQTFCFFWGGKFAFHSPRRWAKKVEVKNFFGDSLPLKFFSYIKVKQVLLICLIKLNPTNVERGVEKIERITMKDSNEAFRLNLNLNNYI